MWSRVRKRYGQRDLDPAPWFEDLVVLAELVPGTDHLAGASSSSPASRSGPFEWCVIQTDVMTTSASQRPKRVQAHSARIEGGRAGA